MATVDVRNYCTAFPPDVDQKFMEIFKEEKWNAIKNAIGRAPGYTAIRVNTRAISLTEATSLLEKEIEDFNERLKLMGRETIQVLPHSILKDVLLLSVSPPSVNIPEYCPDENNKDVVVDRLCGEAVLRGSDIYSPGILSASPSIRQGDIVNILVEIDAKTSTRGTPLEGNTSNKVFVGRGVSEMSRSGYFRNSKGLAVKVTDRLLGDSPPLNGVLQGMIYLQNIPSVVVSHELNPQSGEMIIDLCAGPGGKTSHIATLMQNNGLLVACDRSKRKAEEIQDLCSSFDLNCVVALKMDSTKIVLPKGEPVKEPLDIVNLARDVQDSKLLKIKGFSPETFDKVLLDPPCSALGLRPRLLHSASCKELDTYVSMQRNLLWSAFFLLKPGGTLVYSTCTFNPAENEQMIRYALDTYPLALQAQETVIGDIGMTGQGLSDNECKMVQRFDPVSSTDVPGFFCAKMIKTKSIRHEDFIQSFNAKKLTTSN